jgi:hypothetical protein
MLLLEPRWLLIKRTAYAVRYVPFGTNKERNKRLSLKYSTHSLTVKSPFRFHETSYYTFDIMRFLTHMFLLPAL